MTSKDERRILAHHDVTIEDQTLLYADIANHEPGGIPPAPYPPPAPDAVRGRGLWLSQEFCDDLRVTLSPQDTVVRVQISPATRHPVTARPSRAHPITDTPQRPISAT
jgi:hypothetical protein